VPRGASKALSCPARLNVQALGTSLVTSTQDNGGGGGGGGGCGEEDVAATAAAVRATEAVFMSFPVGPGPPFLPRHASASSTTLEALVSWEVTRQRHPMTWNEYCPALVPGA
jgi:hypothetical protein